MLSFSRLLADQSFYGDSLRYHPHSQGATRGTRHDQGPIVVWNCTQACNLFCRHCYAAATSAGAAGELSTEEGKAFIDELAAYRVPVLLFSGGEPLMRPDLFELMEHGRHAGLRMVISTNGTLIDEATATRIKALGISYVGISLDGTEGTNDAFRGRKGAFQQALAGLRNCREVGQKTGLRLTLSKTTLPELPAIFQLIEAEKIPRACFYHLVYTGRGAAMEDDILTHQETRQVMDYLMEKTADFAARGLGTEILTVDNHCDGIYLYLKLKDTQPQRAAKILELLTTNGGNRSGSAIAAVDWHGNVHIDQFTREITLGNIRQAGFSTIWEGQDNLFLQQLRSRSSHLLGRCATCRWQPQCNGNFRARALSIGDIWNPDPACYLTDAEICAKEGENC